jgi:hypothetical protein
MLKSFESFGEPCSWNLQGTLIFAEKLEGLKTPVLKPENL